VINAYFALLQAYTDSRGNDCERCKFVNTQVMAFFTNDEDNGHKKKLSLNCFNYDRVFFPTNVSECHWALIEVSTKEKKVRYFDSLGWSGQKYLDMIMRYLEFRHQQVDFSSWHAIDMGKSVPQQDNKDDCGIFCMMYADYRVDNLPLDFEMSDILGFRKKIALDILRGHVKYYTPEVIVCPSKKQFKYHCSPCGSDDDTDDDIMILN
jgi:sentrin-specific protease 1